MITPFRAVSEEAMHFFVFISRDWAIFVEFHWNEKLCWFQIVIKRLVRWLHNNAIKKHTVQIPIILLPLHHNINTHEEMIQRLSCVICDYYEKSQQTRRQNCSAAFYCIDKSEFSSHWQFSAKYSWFASQRRTGALVHSAHVNYLV